VFKHPVPVTNRAHSPGPVSRYWFSHRILEIAPKRRQGIVARVGIFRPADGVSAPGRCPHAISDVDLERCFWPTPPRVDEVLVRGQFHFRWVSIPRPAVFNALLSHLLLQVLRCGSRSLAKKNRLDSFLGWLLVSVPKYWFIHCNAFFGRLL